MRHLLSYALTSINVITSKIMAVYKLKTTKRQALPRSKRLRELGGGGGGATSSVVTINSGGNVTPGAAHYHANKAALDQITTDADGYQYITRLVEQPDGSLKEVTEKVKAGTADYANDISPEALTNLPYLSKLADDVAKGKITFEQGLKSLGAAIFGEYTSGLNGGKGAAIDELGNAEVESLRVRTYFECLEIIVNKLSTIEGDQLLTEADTIERVEELSGGRYRIHIKPKYDGYKTSQVANNILKGMVNTLGSGGDEYYAAWFKVDRVNTVYNYMDVTVYADADVPAGVNYPPCELMRVARWGNTADTTRQSCIYLSSTEGRIVHLTGVNTPKVTAANYGATFGSLPEFLAAMDLPIVKGQDYVYARGLVVQDIIRVDYQGKPQAEIIDRGQWVSGGSYYAADLNPTTGTYETSDVWHYGCRYRCAKTGTTIEPAYGVTDWAMVEGNPELMVGFKEDVIFCAPSNFSATLTVVVKAYNQDITETISDSDVSWSRYSETAWGEHRLPEDILWAADRRTSGKVLSLTIDDLGYDPIAPPRVVRFIATVKNRYLHI